MSIDWNWGYSCNRPPSATLPTLGWLWSGFQITVALSISASDHRFSRRLTVRHFTHGPQSLPLGHWHLLCRTVSQRAADRAVLYTGTLVVPEFLPENIGMWFKSELDPNIQFFVSSMLCLGLFTAARVCEQVRAAIQSLPRGQKNAGPAMGLTLPQTYRYVLLPNAYRVIVPPMTSEMMNW